MSDNNDDLNNVLGDMDEAQVHDGEAEQTMEEIFEAMNEAPAAVPTGSENAKAPPTVGTMSFHPPWLESLDPAVVKAFLRLWVMYKGRVNVFNTANGCNYPITLLGGRIVLWGLDAVKDYVAENLNPDIMSHDQLKEEEILAYLEKIAAEPLPEGEDAATVKARLKEILVWETKYVSPLSRVQVMFSTMTRDMEDNHLEDFFTNNFF